MLRNHGACVSNEACRTDCELFISVACISTNVIRRTQKLAGGSALPTSVNAARGELKEIWTDEDCLRLCLRNMSLGRSLPRQMARNGGYRHGPYPPEPVKVQRQVFGGKVTSDFQMGCFRLPAE